MTLTLIGLPLLASTFLHMLVWIGPPCSTSCPVAYLPAVLRIRLTWSVHMPEMVTRFSYVGRCCELMADAYER